MLCVRQCGHLLFRGNILDFRRSVSDPVKWLHISVLVYICVCVFVTEIINIFTGDWLCVCWYTGGKGYCHGRNGEKLYMSAYGNTLEDCNETLMI